MAWSNVQYLMGLSRLGHDVYYVEDSDDYPSCYDPSRGVTDADPAYGLAFAGSALRRIGLGERWAYHDAHRDTWLGPCSDRIAQTCEDADLVLDLAGVNPIRPWLTDAPVRILVDEDPGFTQVRHRTDEAHRERALAHNAFFTFASNFGRSGCVIPSDGLPWLRTRQPLVVDSIAVSPGVTGGLFTTVMQWESYPALCHGGVRYGLKSDSFTPYFELPSTCGHIFELALGGANAPRDRLRSCGWRLADPLRPTSSIRTYQRYIEGSKGEFSVAKHGYVATWSGWFSERSLAYMATGRPVVVQDTGFTDWLDIDLGVRAFSTPDEARAALEDVQSRYEAHCEAAREVAVAHFDSDRVLGRLIDEAFAAAPTFDAAKARDWLRQVDDEVSEGAYAAAD